MAKHVFNAGPCLLPDKVYDKAVDAIRNFAGTGVSLLSISHRTKEWDAVMDGTRALWKELLDIPEGYETVFLGSGASMSAVMNGKSVDTSMGLTPLEGLVMGTRSGDMDPAIVEFIANKENKSISEVMTILNKESGVYGLSGGISSDFRDLEKAAKEGNELAEDARQIFCYRVVKYIGAYTAAMNGVDAITFTA